MCYFFVLLERLMFNITMMIQRSGQWACQLSCDFFILTYSDCSSVFFIHVIQNCPSGNLLPLSHQWKSCPGAWHSMPAYPTVIPSLHSCNLLTPLTYLFQPYWTPRFPPALENRPAFKTVLFVPFSCICLFSDVHIS